MECKYCGAPIPEGETLCPACGKAQEADAAEETAEKEETAEAAAEEAAAEAQEAETAKEETAEADAADADKKQRASRSIRAAEKKAAQARAKREEREEHTKKRKVRKTGDGKKGKGKKIALIASLAAVLVAAVVITVVYLLNRPAPFILYEKDSQLCIELYKDGSYRQLTEDISTAMRSTDINYMQEGCVYCEKTGVLYYLDHYLLQQQVTSDVIFDLYSVDLHVKNASELMPQMVAQFVTDFSVTPDGKYVYYMTEYGQVYRAGKEGDPIKLCEGAAAFTVLQQGSRQLCFVTGKQDEKGAQTNTLYHMDKAGSKAVLADNVGTWTINKTAGIAAYTQGDSVYTVKNGKTAKHIAASVGNDPRLVGVAPDGRVYYTVAAEDTLTLASLITDDLADADAALKEGDAGYALKVRRDRIRAAVKTAPLFEEGVGTLWTAKNGKKTSLAERVGYTRQGTDKASDKLVFGAYTVQADYRINIAALADSLDVFTAEAVRSYLMNTDDVITDFRLSVAVGGESAFLTSLDPVVARKDAKAFDRLQIRFAPNGKTMYYLADPTVDTGAGTLTSVAFSGKTAKAGKALYQGVLTYGFTDNGKLITLRNPVKQGAAGTGSYFSCELFVDGKKADDNVSYFASKLYDDTLYQFFNAGGAKFYYPVNHFSGNNDDFRYYNGSSKSDVIQKVHMAAAADKKAVFFVDSYNTNVGSGTLKYYNGKKAVQADTFVQNVFCPPTAKD